MTRSCGANHKAKKIRKKAFGKKKFSMIYEYGWILCEKRINDYKCI